MKERAAYRNSLLASALAGGLMVTGACSARSASELPEAYRCTPGAISQLATTTVESVMSEQLDKHISGTDPQGATLETVAINDNWQIRMYAKFSQKLCGFYGGYETVSPTGAEESTKPSAMEGPMVAMDYTDDGRPSGASAVRVCISNSLPEAEQLYDAWVVIVECDRTYPSETMNQSDPRLAG